jgi:hypothetical protein
VADGGLDRWQGAYIASIFTTVVKSLGHYGLGGLYNGMLLATSWLRRGDDGFAEVFADCANGLWDAHSGLGCLGGLDDGCGEEFVLDLEDLGESCYLVGLRGVSKTFDRECSLTHLELDGINDFFEVFCQDVALDGERAHAFVLFCKIGVDAASEEMGEVREGKRRNDGDGLTQDSAGSLARFRRGRS